MLKTLYSKLALVLLGLLLLVGILFVIMGVYSTEMYQQETSQKLNRELAKQIVSEKIILQDNKIDRDALKEIFHMLMVINPSIEIYLLDSRGEILAFSAESGKVKRKRVALEPIQHFLEKEAVFPIMGDDPKDLQEKKVFSVAPIPGKSPPQGYIYVILGGEIYDNVIKKLHGSYIMRLSLWAVAASISVAIIAGLLVFWIMTRRLERLVMVMDNYEGGTAKEQLALPPVKGKHPSDEIDRLILTFGTMAARIEEQVRSLKNADTQRRELIANVSHDFRTPLATLKGYVETLLMKESGLTGQERRNYLKIIIKHCERVNKLVMDLFELAQLEAPDMQIHPEPFQLSELVQDVVQKFHLVAREKKLRLETNVSHETPFVYADIGLIERVIENLLENAVNYTPQNGKISIVLLPAPDKVQVRISDTGCGIPETELANIFTRSFQLDPNGKNNSQHRGLGLAIVKQILELHASDIDAWSTLNNGTTFSFSLPIYQPD